MAARQREAHRVKLIEQTSRVRLPRPLDSALSKRKLRLTDAGAHLAETKAGQTHRKTLLPCAIEETAKIGIDIRLEIGRGTKRQAVCAFAEIRIPHFDGDRADRLSILAD